MIIKGKKRAGFVAMAHYILDLKDDRATKVVGVSNFEHRPTSTWDAMEEMYLAAVAKMHDPRAPLLNPLLHIEGRGVDGEEMTPDMARFMAKETLTALGLKSHKAIIWMDQNKAGDWHWHAAALRVGPDGKVPDPRFMNKICQDVAREMEAKFGLTPSTDFANSTVKEYWDNQRKLSELWNRSKDMSSEQARLFFSENGFEMALGEKAKYVFVDSNNSPHNILRNRDLKLSKQDLEKRFNGLDTSKLHKPEAFKDGNDRKGWRPENPKLGVTHQKAQLKKDLKRFWDATKGLSGDETIKSLKKKGLTLALGPQNKLLMMSDKKKIVLNPLRCGISKKDLDNRFAGIDRKKLPFLKSTKKPVPAPDPPKEEKSEEVKIPTPRDDKPPAGEDGVGLLLMAALGGGGNASAGASAGAAAGQAGTASAVGTSAGVGAGRPSAMAEIRQTTPNQPKTMQQGSGRKVESEKKDTKERRPPPPSLSQTTRHKDTEPPPVFEPDIDPHSQDLIEHNADKRAGMSRAALEEKYPALYAEAKRQHQAWLLTRREQASRELFLAPKPPPRA